MREKWDDAGAGQVGFFVGEPRFPTSDRTSFDVLREVGCNCDGNRGNPATPDSDSFLPAYSGARHLAARSIEYRVPDLLSFALVRCFARSFRSAMEERAGGISARG